MTLPLFDEVDLPPDSTLVDVNKVPLDYMDGRLAYQALALGHYMEQIGDDWEVGREWNDEEAIFVVVNNPTVVTDDVLASGEIIGFVIVLEPEEV